MKKVHIFGGAVLLIMGLLMIGSMRHDAATFDESAHIPAGYSYITQRDYRLNPEHPPLLKALSGLSAYLFVHPRFPTDIPSWQNDINGQWAQGATFLYGAGNDAEAIIFWSRIPVVLLTLLFGWLLFLWTKKRLGTTTAYLTLVLFSFSPSVLAHARYVTTDVAAAFGFFIGLATFIAFLEHPTKRNVFCAGIALGIAELFKFSLALLVPIDLIILTVWFFVSPTFTHHRKRFSAVFTRIGQAALIALIGLLVIWGTYAYFTANYPPDRQLRDAQSILSTYGSRTPVNIDFALIKNPLTRPLGHYLLGVLTAQQRATGGNTSYFLGTVTAAGSRFYFPLLYLVKESLAFHILTLIALFLAIVRIKKSMRKGAPPLSTRLRTWLAAHPVEFSSIVFILFYWGYSIKSPLNIGVRHVLPTFPFIYLLVARQIALWIHDRPFPDPRGLREWLRNMKHAYISSIPKIALVSVLMLWLIISTLATYPHFLSYYNILGGGTAQGYHIAVDSNYDWGQDLYRLVDFADEHAIKKIALDYFGGGSPSYSLGDRFLPWWSAKGAPHGWFAVSATLREGSQGIIDPALHPKPEDSYQWLRAYTPVARAGTSIFIYQLP